MGSDAIERLERALERTFRSGSCRFRAEVSGSPLHGEIDLEAGIARSQLGASHIVPRPTAEQVHRGAIVYQPVDDTDGPVWIAMPVGSGGCDPTGMLDLLRGAVSARPSRVEESGHLEVEIDVDRASARAEDASVFATWVDATGLPDRLSVTVDLDDGRVRHVRGVFPAVAGAHPEPTTIEVMYGDFGAPVDIVVPPEERLV